MDTVKTTLYLPKSIKRSLERASAAEGKSQSELIREAIELRVRERPDMPVFNSGDPSFAAEADKHLRGFGES